MKNNIFILIALAAVSVGCTKSGLVETPQKYQTPIEFETYNGRVPSTKASIVDNAVMGTSNENAPAFHVNAFLTPEPQNGYQKTYMSKDVWCTSMTSDDPTTTENEYSAEWAYNGKTYWPENGTLQFVAYGLNADKSIGTGESQFQTITWDETKKYTKFTYTVPSKASEQEDLIVAIPVTQGITNNTVAPVQLNFQHMLSRVGFTLKTDYENDVLVTIKSIVLKGEFYGSGTVEMTADTPSVTTATSNVFSYSLFDTQYSQGAENGSYDVFQIKSPGTAGAAIYANKTLALTSSEGKTTETYAENADAAVANRYMMLIPSTQAGAEIEVIYQLEGAKEQKAVASLDADFPFTQGYSYEFVLTVSTSSIEFTPEISPWIDTTYGPILNPIM